MAHVIVAEVLPQRSVHPQLNLELVHVRDFVLGDDARPQWLEPVVGLTQERIRQVG